MYGGGTGMLRTWVEAGLLVVEVVDRGVLSDPLAGQRPFEEEPEYGRGLLLVNQVVDLMRTHTGTQGTTRRVHLRLH
ncbi:hypothetical protein GCM10009830_24670 [Glycomyces endophyticus]|uniref:Histidine kinase/HSP90-like ATPase domain-containing protein n=1 Tax=Glycomyces endophyticus TaxID=480996 RepID=A0ABP4SR97_9ACTN